MSSCFNAGTIINHKRLVLSTCINIYTHQRFTFANLLCLLVYFRLTMKGLLLSVVVLVLAVYVAIWIKNKPRVRYVEEIYKEYDFIVVGSGSSGGIVATRLSENENVSVLLLEAGPEETDYYFSHIPGMAWELQLTDFDWKHKTIPLQTCCGGLVGRQQTWPRARGLGGCSSHNAMHHVRGSRYDYDHWEKDLKNKGWSYENVLPYFKKLENMQIDRLKSSPYHNVGGPINVIEGARTPLGDIYVDIVQKLGHKIVDDPNGEEQGGFHRSHFIVKNGKRQSTAECYIRPALSRTNFHVLPNSHVTKIMIETKNGEHKATGVEFIHRNLKKRVLARKEVIVAGGAINTPQLMMLSGIGPKEHLESFGIKVLVDNPAVGSNLHDHPFTHILFAVDKELAGPSLKPSDGYRFYFDLAQWYLLGTGPLTQFGLDVNGFKNASASTTPWPDFHIYLSSYDLHSNEVFYNFKPHRRLPLDKGKGLVSGVAALLHPYSVGTIRLHSADPFDHPLIDPNMMSDERDIDNLAEALEFVLNVSRRPELVSHGYQIAEDAISECEHIQPTWSRDYLRCHVKNRLMAMYHPVGTCRMGPKGENSVVDERLRVHGVKSLRVVDASIFPDQVSGNTNTPSFMVGEKGADLIKEDYKL